jgi:hypothetical protein
VYGDFIYVSRTAAPLFAQPDGIWVHDNHVARSGRQGISVTGGTRVVLERNVISDVRRATFALEPGTNGVVRDLYIRNNLIGPGRLLFVAGHGGGDVSDLFVTGNVLHAKSLGIDLSAPDGVRRSNVVVSGNTSDLSEGNGRMAFMRFVGYDHVVVTNNREPGARGRDMRMVGLFNTCSAVVSGNSTGQFGGPGQLVVLAPAINCEQRSAPRPFVAPTWSTGSAIKIDAGGGRTIGARGCLDMKHCDALLSGAPALVTTKIENSADPAMGTLLVGEQRWDIPLRPGTYEVTLSLVEPKPEAHLFHLDTDHGRVLLAFDTFAAAGGRNRVVERSFRAVTGDGALTLSFLGDPGVAYIKIVRV